MKNKNFYATQVKKRTQINKERRINVASRWEVVEILRSTHAIFPLGTRLIQSTKHKSARKKGDLNRVGMRKNERYKRSCTLPDLSERPGNTAWGGRLTMWEVLGSSRSFSYAIERRRRKDPTRMSGIFSGGEGGVHPPPHATHPTQPLPQPDISDSLSLSCEILRNFIRILRSDRFRLGSELPGPGVFPRIAAIISPQELLF